MRKLAMASLAVLAFALSGSMVSSVVAQDKKTEKSAATAARKVVAENAKVLAFEVTFAPGAVNTAVPSSSVRVVRALAGGTLERTYADGKKENIVYKTGEVRINEASPAFTTKNIGKSEIKLYVVQVK
jgi:outer membrane lipoprotein-sorting protein